MNLSEKSPARCWKTMVKSLQSQGIKRNIAEKENMGIAVWLLNFLVLWRSRGCGAHSPVKLAFIAAPVEPFSAAKCHGKNLACQWTDRRNGQREGNFPLSETSKCSIMRIFNLSLEKYVIDKSEVVREKWHSY